jgi:CheY-like chemotaxis protein
MTTTLPMRVLVVDDSDDAAVTLAFLLKRCGHEAVIANSAQSAFEQAPLFHPDVMFIDLSMPQIDGFSVARQLRQTAEFADTPLVAVSGHVDAEHRAEATAAGFTEFLAKPYPLEILQATLERAAARVSAARMKAAAARQVARQTRQLNDQSRQNLDDYWRTRHEPAVVSVKKSGISNMLTTGRRSDAEELRSWLKEQTCRVGPVFEQSTGQWAFFVYSKRHSLCELIAKHGAFRVHASSL